MSPCRVEGNAIRLVMYLYISRGLEWPKIDYRRRRVYSWSQYNTKMRVSTPSSPMLQ
jgi:hypothetical protein